MDRLQKGVIIGVSIAVVATILLGGVLPHYIGVRTAPETITQVRPDVRVVTVSFDQVGGIHGLTTEKFIVHGDIINVGNGTSAPITVGLYVTSDSTVLLTQNTTAIPETLAPKQQLII